MAGWTESFCSELQVEINRTKLATSCRFYSGWSKNTESDTHVVTAWRAFSDAGSTPAASTKDPFLSLRVILNTDASRCFASARTSAPFGPSDLGEALAGPMQPDSHGYFGAGCAIRDVLDGVAVQVKPLQQGTLLGAARLHPASDFEYRD